MKQLKDDVKIRDIIMPGTHNSGSRKMILPMANCQNMTLREQFEKGVRYFDIRLDTSRGRVVFSHSIIMGKPIEDDLREFGKALVANPSEFSVICIKRYGNDTIGPIHHKCNADRSEVDRILAATINPAAFALTDFRDIGEVTLGDARKSGKRYILINDEKEYKFSKSCTLDCSWQSERNGKALDEFIPGMRDAFDETEGKGFFVLETQQTGGPGTAVGLSSPATVYRRFLPRSGEITDMIAGNPEYLKKANVIAGDYMGDDEEWVNRIIGLNTIKGNTVDNS